MHGLPADATAALHPGRPLTALPSNDHTSASESGLLLLEDLCCLHLAAARNSLHWEMLARTAQAIRDEKLLALVSSCHPQTLRQMRWTNTMIKNLCPQILTSL